MQCHWWQTYDRILICNQKKRTSDDVNLRYPTNPFMTGMNTELFDIPNTDGLDGVGENGYVSPFSEIILVCCGGGGGCHNNLQWVAKGGMGDNSYIAKYVSKGMGSLVQTLPLLFDALNANKTSVAPDLPTNPYRPAVAILQRCLILKAKQTEFLLPLMCGVSLNMAQFACSHDFRFINVHCPRKYLLLLSSAKSINSDEETKAIEQMIGEDLGI